MRHGLCALSAMGSPRLNGGKMGGLEVSCSPRTDLTGGCSPPFAQTLVLLYHMLAGAVSLQPQSHATNDSFSGP